MSTELLTPNKKVNIAIAEIVPNYVVTLEDANDTLAKISRARMFDDELVATQRNFQMFWMSENEVFYQYAKLNLYATALMDAGEATSEPSMKYALGKHDSSLSLIRYVYRFGSLGTPDDTRLADEVLQHLPRVFFNGMFFAANFLSRFITNTRATSSTQKTSAVDALADVLGIFQRFPNHRDAARAAGQVEDFDREKRFSGADSIETSFPGSLAVTDRLGS